MATRITAVTTPAINEKLEAPPCAMVVFGASGDLSSRKLIPAMHQLFCGGFLSDRFAIVGVARRALSSEDFRREMHAAVAERSTDANVDPGVWDRFDDALEYVPGEFSDPQTYRRLAEKLAQLDRERGVAGNRLFYLATPPTEFERIVQCLSEAGLLQPPHQEPWTRVIIEKPFGRDLESARRLNEILSKMLDESQIFRIDHYLGKETVQNIMVLRFANAIFEPIWNRRYVQYVEICAAEAIGVGTRGRFYEETGVLRDIVQNHMLEVLALTAMEPPITASADDIRTEKLKVLNALRDLPDDQIERDVVLGQYRGYRDEPNVSPSSTTPTYAALRVFVDNWRWQGVPFYLRSGKMMPRRVTQVSLHFQPVPLRLFGSREEWCSVESNVLTLRIQPDEGISLRFESKIPGHRMAIGTVAMDMDYVETFGGKPAEAYERLLLDAMRGDATLFSRRDAVEASWTWITPILEHFERRPPRDFPNYDPKTSGPERARELIERDRLQWAEL
ncbi:MAG TPA: glucose-6-phosphate dehydrogenase [Candidatus Limnocylindrales bacterium]|nr:glucose-6-phosphate dehydrogenase [Candidatus Limnocylindrales bacterium]